MRIRLAVVLALAGAAMAQPPAFEVASVKISEPITPEAVQAGRVNIGVSIDARHVRISKFSMGDLALLAFQVKGHQIAGPSWMVNERYDVQATLPENGTRGQVPAMLQTLLAERFGLRFHRETREFNVYGVVVAKGGHHLKPATEDPESAAPPTPGAPIRGGIAVSPGGAMASSGPNGSWRITPGEGGNLHIETRKMTMKGFVDFIARYYDRPVVDMTDVPGRFDMELDISGEEVRNAARAHGVVIRSRESEGASDPAGVRLSDSIQRLGLKIEGRKAPAEVIVIDQLEKIPTGN